MFRYASLAAKSTLRNRRRSILTISSMAVSLCLLGILIAIYHALFFGDPTPGQALRLMTRHKVSLGLPLPLAYEDKIRRLPGVKVITVYNWFGGTYKDNRDRRNFFARFGVEPAPFLALRTQLEMPDDQRQAFLKDRRACVISKDLSDRLNLKVGDRVMLKGDIYPVDLDLTIRGIFDDPDATLSLFFNRDYLNESLPTASRNYISMFAMLADTTDDVPRIAKGVDEMFANAPMPTKTEPEQQFLVSFISFLGNVKVFLMVICAAVTFTILLVSGNTMAMSVRERIKEVGVLKTLGYTREAILAIIVGEAVTISAIGGAIGLLLATLLSVGVGKVGEAFVAQLKHLSMTPVTAALAMLLALLIGVVSSFIPAWNASKTDILTALRYSG